MNGDMTGGRGELLHLGIAVLIGLLHIVLAAAAGAGGGGRDMKWLLGARDEDRPTTSLVAQRLARAQANFFETFPLFAAALLTVYLLGKVGPLSHWGAVLYVFGRAVYLPFYALGLPVVRSLAWTVAVVGLVLVIAALFFPR